MLLFGLMPIRLVGAQMTPVGTKCRLHRPRTTHSSYNTRLDRSAKLHLSSGIEMIKLVGFLL